MGAPCAFCFFFSSRRRHTRFDCDWSSDVCSSDLGAPAARARGPAGPAQPEHPAGLRRDRHELRVPAVAAGGDPSGEEGLMPTALPGTRRVEQIMGMPIVVDVRDDDVDDGPLERGFGWLRSVDATFSTYRDDSVISRLRRGETTREEAPPDVR